MAFMSQERKAGIAAELKRVIPKGWKYSVAVRDRSTICLTIAAAPVDLLAGLPVAFEARHRHMNPYHWRPQNTWQPEIRDVFASIFAAMNRGNHDRSDPMTDYFDVGWYVDVNIGRWDRPFTCTAPQLAVAA